MRNVLQLSAIILLLLSVCTGVYADLGPKPQAQFTFDSKLNCPGDFFEDTPECQLLQCQKADCSDANALRRYGPQHWSCNEYDCSALAYGFTPYGKLHVQLAEGSRESNVFRMSNGLAQKYTVTRTDTGLLVAETSGSLFRRLFGWIVSFLLALIVTVAIEIGFVSILIWRNWLPREARRTVLVANLVSLPLAWLVIQLANPPALGWILAEIGAIVGEATVLRWRHQDAIPMWKATCTSIIANTLSLFIGGFIVIVLLYYLHLA